jgi:hypothetical protein
MATLEAESATGSDYRLIQTMISRPRFRLKTRLRHQLE